MRDAIVKFKHVKPSKNLRNQKCGFVLNMLEPEDHNAKDVVVPFVIKNWELAKWSQVRTQIEETKSWSCGNMSIVYLIQCSILGAEEYSA